MDNRRRRNPTIQEYAAYGIGGIFINLGIIAEQFGMYYMTNVALLRGVERLGGWAAGWQRFILVVWCIGLPASFICQQGMRFVDYPGSIPTHPRRTVFHHLLQLAKNRPVVCVCAAISLSFLPQTINNVSSMYYYEYVLGDTSVLELTAIYSLPISLACNFVIPFVLERMDKRHLLLVA